MLSEKDFETLGELWLEAQRLPQAHLASFLAGVRAASAHRASAAQGASGAAPYDAAAHNELSRRFTMDILGEALKRGATPEQVMVLIESCVMGTYLALVRLGGDDKVLDVMVEGIRQRLAEKRLGGLDSAGQA